MTFVQCVVTSFGFGHDAPPDAAIVRDLRGLFDNPMRNDAIKQMTGRDTPVIQYVMSTPGIAGLIERSAIDVHATLTEAPNPRGFRVDFAVGCTGGRHRSVVVADHVAAALRVLGVGVEVEHRDIDKPIIQKPKEVTR